MSEKKSKYNRAENLGEYAKKGGPGRPKGSKNKFTLIKDQIAELWEEEGLKEKLREALLEDKAFLRRFVKEIVIPILPKEPLIDQSTHYTEITYGWAEEENNDRLPTSRLSEGDSQPPIKV